MKSKLLLSSLFTFLIFNIGIAQPQWIFRQSLISDDKADTINVYFESKFLLSGNNDNHITYFAYNQLLANYSNKVLIRSNTDKIKEIQVPNGTSERLNDSTFVIVTKKLQDDIYLTLLGHKKYKFLVTIKPLPEPKYFCLKNLSYVIQREFPRYEGLRYTIDDIIRNGKLSIVPFFGMDSLYKIIEFQLSVTGVRNDYMTFFSPIFKNDSIPSDYAESVRKYFTKPVENGLLSFKFQYIKFIGPDSVVWTINNADFALIYKDSTDLIISKYYIKKKVIRSNIRIKVFGNPYPEDMQTINNIVKEINLLNADIKAKIVDFFPSIGIYIDSLDTSFGKGALTGTEQGYYKNLFFPKLSYTKIFINTKIKEQADRDLFLLQKITRSLADFFGQPTDYKNSVIIGKNKTPGLTSEDKLALKEILSNNFDKKGDLFIQSPTPDLSKILLLVFITMILFFILYELNSYFNLGRFFKNVFLLNLIYCILIAQLFILTSFYIQKDFLKEWHQREIYFCSFALAAGLLFFVSDRLLNKQIRATWLRLTLSPVFTLISLYIAYQFIYLFVRAEFLRFITIDINAIIIGLSIMVVRFYLLYENEKVTSLLQEKEYELTRQKELKNRAELSTLQAKINPHFLYNALNSIAALAHIDSTRTEEMALSLSKLFRYNLNREEDMISTIRQEIEMVQLYLQIEKQRFADRLSFEVSITENLFERQVPRFLIQPLVENAIKHGVSQITGQGIIKLKVYEEDKSLFIEIHDNGPRFPQGLVTGYGLQNTYDKLTLVYKKPYEVRFVNEPEKYIQIKL